MNKMGEDIFPCYMEVRRADVLAQSMYKREEKVKNLDEIEELYRQNVDAGQCVSLKSLAVTGKDLIAAGMEPGKYEEDLYGDELLWYGLNVSDASSGENKEKYNGKNGDYQSRLYLLSSIE